MKIFKYIKKVGGLIVTAGAAFVIEDLLKANTPAPKSFWKRTVMRVGIAAIAGLVAKKAADSFKDEVDDLEEVTVEIIKEVDKIKEDSREVEA